MTTEPQRLGKYELQKRLGYGGMGEVWKAFDTQLQRYIAIKLLHPNWQDDPGFVDRFKREAQFIASLHHPHIMQIHDFYISEPPETASTFAYMVMDYIQGQTLADFIRETSRKGNFPAPEDIVYILTGVSLALDYAHQRGMIHRDIKPSNILLDQRPPLVNPLGKPVLIDFGIARLQGASMVTVAGALVGTPQYISPEQALGRQSNYASDLYALGIILYEMMTGVTPFRGDTTIAVLMQHIHELPTPPETINTAISPALSQIIIKSIAKAPADRFQSATEMTIAVARALGVPIPRSLLNNTAGTTSTGEPSSSAQPSQTSVHAAMARPTPVGVEDVASTNPSQVEPVTSARGFSYTAPAALPHPAAPPMLTPAHPPAPAKQQASARTRLLMLLGVFLCIFALSSAGAWWHFTHMSSGQTAPAASGKVTFSHSSNYSQGGYDTVQIDMQGVPTPPAGKAYYAWIESGANEQYRPHWQLAVHDGSVHMTHLTSAGYPNLLLPDTILLITLENTGSYQLVVPNTDLANRLYYAPLQQRTSPPVFTLQKCPVSDSSSICLR